MPGQSFSSLYISGLTHPVSSASRGVTSRYTKIIPSDSRPMLYSSYCTSQYYIHSRTTNGKLLKTQETHSGISASPHQYIRGNVSAHGLKVYARKTWPAPKGTRGNNYYCQAGTVSASTHTPSKCGVKYLVVFLSKLSHRPVLPPILTMDPNELLSPEGDSLERSKSPSSFFL